MTILLVSHTADLNGAERSLFDLALGLKEQAVNCLVLCPTEGPLVTMLREAEISTLVMKLPRPQRRLSALLLFLLLWLPIVVRLAHWLRKNGIAVVYNNTIDGLYAPFAAYLVGVPCVWHVREVKPGSRRLRRFFSWLLNHLSTNTVFNSQTTMRAYATQANPTWEVVYNGVEIKAPPPLRDNPVVVIGYAGQLVTLKRPDRFVNILAAVIDICPTVKGVMVGDGILLDELRRFVADKNLAHVIQIAGQVGDMASFYQEIDILVLTSDAESFGRVIIEAMSFGRPVIAANVGGVSEVVVDGETGFLVSADDIAAYTEKIILLATNRDLCAQMGLAGYRRVKNCFSIAQYRQQLIEILQQASQR